MQLNAPDLADHIFTFGTRTGGVITRAFKLSADHRVVGFRHPATRLWRFRDHALELLGSDGAVSCTFNDYDPHAVALVGVDRSGNGLLLRDSTAGWTGLPPRPQFEVVVARCDEPVDWVDVVPHNVTVYNKGGPCPCPSAPLPNVGREFHTYLFHIVDRWDTLADRTLFVQGSPFDHHLLPLPLYAQGDFVTLLNSVKRFDDTWISGRSKRAFCERYVRTDVPYHFQHSDGAQFSAARTLIYVRGKAYWQDLLGLSGQRQLGLADVTIDNYGIGLLFEMFWPYILNPSGAATLPAKPINTGDSAAVMDRRQIVEHLNAEHRVGVHAYQPMRFDW